MTQRSPLASAGGGPRANVSEFFNGLLHVRSTLDASHEAQATVRSRSRLGRVHPSKKRIARVCKKISAITDRRRSGLDPAEVVGELNRVLRGWAGYFRLGPVSDTYRAISAHARYRFRKWWGAKHKNARFGPCRYWSPWLERTFGLLQLRWDPSRLPHANA